MSRLYRSFFDEICDDTKKCDAFHEAVNMGYDCHKELIHNYEKCHIKHKGVATNNASMEVDVLDSDYDWPSHDEGHYLS